MKTLIPFLILIVLISCKKEEIPDPRIIRQPYPVYLPGDTIRDTTIIEKPPVYRDYPVYYEFVKYNVDKLSIPNTESWERRNVGFMEHLSKDLAVYRIMDISNDPLFVIGNKFVEFFRTDSTLTMIGEKGDTLSFNVEVKDLFNEIWRRIEHRNGVNYHHTIQCRIQREKIIY